MQDEYRPTTPQETVQVMAALSDINRYRIVELLGEGARELTCGAICTALHLSPSLVSHHLSVLEGAGVIERRKNGLWTLNRLRRDELARRLAGLQRMIYTNGNVQDTALSELSASEARPA